MFHTAQYYTVAVAPVGMFDNYATKVYGFDPLQGSWDQSANGGDGAIVQKMETIINGHSDVFAGGMQDNGTSIQADNDNGFSLGNDFVVVMVLLLCFHKTPTTDMLCIIMSTTMLLQSLT